MMSQLGSEERPIVLEVKCSGGYTAHIPLDDERVDRPAQAIEQALTESDIIVWATPPEISQVYTVEDYTGAHGIDSDADAAAATDGGQHGGTVPAEATAFIRSSMTTWYLLTVVIWLLFTLLAVASAMAGA